MASIYLSPSTQENNVGAGNYGTEEKRMNEITNIVEAALKGYGMTVFRNKPEMTLKQVVADSNIKQPDVHFAIHSNAFNGRARGCEVFCHRFGGLGERLARAVYNEIEPLTPTGDRGVKEGATFYGNDKPLYETAYTTAPAALIEIAFHDNPDDAKWIVSNINSIANGLVRGIRNYFDSLDSNVEYKKIIQDHCRFSDPEGVWQVNDTHPYASDLYKKWASSYQN